MDRKLTLNTFLKLLTSNDVPVSKAMAVASKVLVFFIGMNVNSNPSLQIQRIQYTNCTRAAR